MGSWLTFRQVLVCAVVLLYPMFRPEADLSSFYVTLSVFLLMMMFAQDVHADRRDWVREAKQKLSHGKRRYASRDVRRS